MFKKDLEGQSQKGRWTNIHTKLSVWEVVNVWLNQRGLKLRNGSETSWFTFICKSAQLFLRFAQLWLKFHQNKLNKSCKVSRAKLASCVPVVYNNKLPILRRIDKSMVPVLLKMCRHVQSIIIWSLRILASVKQLIWHYSDAICFEGSDLWLSIERPIYWFLLTPINLIYLNILSGCNLIFVTFNAFIWHLITVFFIKILGDLIKRFDFGHFSVDPCLICCIHIIQ